MRELSLHILDMVQNSIAAGATVISIEITENHHQNQFIVKIKDNGRGMTTEQVKQVVDPFYTTRTTRKLGFGIPFFKETTEQAGGEFMIQSVPGQGTEIIASLELDHINRPPLGKIAETLEIVILSNPEITFQYQHRVDEKVFQFNTSEIDDLFEASGAVDFMRFNQFKKMIENGIQSLHGND